MSIEQYLINNDNGEQAQAIVAELEAIRAASKGELNTEDVLEKAREEDSAMHSFFEWDDSAAAQQHRLNQARQLVQSVRVIQRRQNKPPVNVRAYVSIAKGHKKRTYVPTEDAMENPVMRQSVLQSAFRDLQSLRKRYAELEEIQPVLDSIDAVLSGADSMAA